MSTTQRASKRGLRRITAAVLGATAAAIALAGCSNGAKPAADGSAEAAPVDKIAMATQPWLGYGPWYIAQENGYFADEGVEVTITNFSDDSEMTAALGSGNIDVANAASHTALQWLENGLEGYVTLMLDTSMTADAILAGEGITSIDDLKGKQVAFEEGSVSNLLLDYALTEHGMTIADIKPVPMAPSDAAAALAGGKVDAAVTYEPYITEALAPRPEIKTLLTAAEQPGLISDVLFVSKKAIEEKPEAIKKLIAAWGPAIKFYESDTAAAQAIIAENIGSDVAALETAFAGVEFFTLEENLEYLEGDYLTSVLPSVQAAATHAGVLSKSLDLSTVLDTQFLK